jgi:nucleotide-binding universal stress UspA family protein
MKTILVPTDFNPLATTALRTAVQLARRTGAKLVVLYADTFAPPVEFTGQQAQSLAAAIDESRVRAAEELERYARELIPGDVGYSVLVREDLPVPAIVKTADAVDADLIVMGTHGRGALARLLIGSVAEAVLAETPRPVLTVNRAGDPRELRTVACAAAEVSDRAATFAADIGAAIVPDADAADLVVTCRTDRSLVRHATVPVLTLG